MDIKLIWKEDELFAGKWKIGSVVWNSFRSKDDPLSYKATCSLPGIKRDLGNFKTIEERKQKLLVAANYWFSKVEEIK